MAADLRIADGTPIWASQAIVPSKDTVVSPNSNPNLAAVTVASTDVRVYVKVDNIGNVDLGTCPCTATLPASWATPVLFGGFFTSQSGTTSQSSAGTTFTAGPIDDNLSGPGFNRSFGHPGSHKRAWAWSPDGRFFAYVSSGSGTDWNLTIVALQAITRSNGTTIPKNGVAVTTSGVFGPAWNATNLGWAGSRAVLLSGPAAGGGTLVDVACPEAPTPNVFGDLLPASAGQIDWTWRVSPCGSVVALVPRRLTTAVAAQSIRVIATATAKEITFRKNNVPTTVDIVGLNPSITTVARGASGVSINTGAGATTTVDDPDCTMVGGGVVARVDRVKASTLPNANLGVASVGAGVAGLIRAGQSAWVQVPNQNPSGWANQGERHWCLLAQTYTSDLTTIPRPWDGQAAMPPPFPVTKVNCAQRNIEIS